MLAAESPYGAPRRAEFLSLHLSLSRLGVFSKHVAGTETARYPYAYNPPQYVSYLERQQQQQQVASAKKKKRPSGGGGGGGTRVEDEATHEEAVIEDELCTDSVSELRLFAEGIALWRLFVQKRKVNQGLLPFNTLQEIVFEVLRAHESARLSPLLWSPLSQAAWPHCTHRH